ncbi:MAG: hypothetical protein EZS28_005703 [Streblomastix strix]|uniref:PH domain-containing protein n=1 Tax=Streblomastix strix TaxID=222440 RepID=A0A5J4WWT3_9EUKA|nr:MAG: hypothetical protein EZS28_005703 [Streblomastix strix]
MKKDHSQLHSKEDEESDSELYEAEEVAFIAKTEDECLKWVQALSGLTGLQIECSDFITEEMRNQLPFGLQNQFLFGQDEDDYS